MRISSRHDRTPRAVAPIDKVLRVALGVLAACAPGAKSTAPDDAATPDTLTTDASSQPSSTQSDAGGLFDSSTPAAPTADTSDAQAAADGGAHDAAPTTDAVAPTFDWTAGDHPSDLHGQTYLELKGLKGQGDRTRQYKVHIPARYDPKLPMPVLYALHGLEQNAVMFVVDGTHWVSTSDQEGFVLVMPNGVQEDGFGGAWNGGVCCGTAAGQKLDDVGFIRAIHSEISAHINIDQHRVYATGLSNGAFMAHRLGCDAADLFVAIAPLAGSIGTSELGSIGTNADPDFKSCTPSQAVAVLAMHGGSDPIVPYSGMKPTLDHWASADGCSTTTVPATVPASGGDTTCFTYQGCPSGIEVTGCTVANGGHCWFGDETCGTGAAGVGPLIVGNNSTFLDATKAAWQFLSRFHR